MLTSDLHTHVCRCICTSMYVTHKPYREKDLKWKRNIFQHIHITTKKHKKYEKTHNNVRKIRQSCPQKVPKYSVTKFKYNG